MHTIRLVPPPGGSARVAYYLSIFRRRVSERCAAQFVDTSPADLTLALALRPGIAREGYSLETAPGGLLLGAGDELGLLYGLGRLLREAAYGPEGFRPGPWRGSDAPEGHLRGMYLASHFHNWYHMAPEEELQRYLEDLALWGLNAISVAVPFVDLRGWDDPAAPASLAQVRKLLGISRGLGLRAGLMMVPNQQFAEMPARFRAVRLPDPLGRRGNLGFNLCPSEPGALELILENDRRLFAELQEPGIDLLCLWPYDEGGCACPRCAPWGANGYLRAGRAVVEVARQHFPGLQVILSTWMFDTPPEGEWEGLSAALARDHSGLDAIMADAHEDYPRYPLEVGVPGGLPLLNFPEISMWGLQPWGGFGANPLPGRLQRLWAQVQGAVSGGFPYSEGLYEDLNKVLVSQFYWRRDLGAEDTLRRYCAFEFGAQSLPDVPEMVALIERNHTTAAVEHRISLADAGRAWALAQQVDARLEPWARRSWRWRLLFLRAFLDRQRYTALGDGPYDPARLAAGWGALLRGNAPAQDALRELIALYHCPPEVEGAPHTWVRPPLGA